MRRLLPSSLTKQCPDVPGPGDATRGGQSKTARRPRGWVRLPHRCYFEPTLTTKRRRPRWRRRLRVLRPPLVCMRARNPCLFFLFRFRGLYVGIIGNHPPSPWLHSKISFQRYPRAPFRVNPGSPSQSWLSQNTSPVKLTFPQSGNSLLPPFQGLFPGVPLSLLPRRTGMSRAVSSVGSPFPMDPFRTDSYRYGHQWS